MASIDNKRDVEQTIYGGGHFPDELPARSAPPPAASKWRRLRTFLTFSPSSYNFIHTPDGQARIRRIVMIIILVLRSGMSALSIISAVVNGNVAGIVIYSLLAILSLWFTATCLAIIGDAAGNRNYTGHVIVSDTRANRFQRKACLLTTTLETLAFRRFPCCLFAHTCRTDHRLVFWSHRLGLGGGWSWNVARHSWCCFHCRVGT
jgi:hypothetical protein